MATTLTQDFADTNLQDRFEIVKVTNPQDPLISKYYEGFSSIFTLPEIRRSEEGIRLWLQTNNNERMQAGNGPTEHALLMVVDKETDQVVGGWDSVKFTTHNLTEDQTNGYLGGAQGTYVWVKDGYRTRDLGEDFFTTLKECAQEDLNEWLGQKTGQSAEGKSFIYFEHEDPTRMSFNDLREDYDAAGITTTQRLRAFAKRGSQIVHLCPPGSSGVYAQTAYPEVGDTAIDQENAADYLLLTAIAPDNRKLTNHVMYSAIKSVATVLATDNGKFNVMDHDVLRRMEQDLKDAPAIQLERRTNRDALIALQALMDKATSEVRDHNTLVGEHLNLPPIDSGTSFEGDLRSALLQQGVQANYSQLVV
ncbi:MAG: hypothetical protein H6861_06820 [Rhodospirillales bacterium]|nr:hypothetical protein [Rhodospirillales bacterium]